jgi:hypothetical protein
VKRYMLWIRLNPTQTVNTYVYARNDREAHQLGEAQFGQGNVLNFTEVLD